MRALPSGYDQRPTGDSVLLRGVAGATIDGEQPEDLRERVRMGIDLNSWRAMLVVGCIVAATHVEARDVAALIAELRSVGAEGRNHAAAMRAWDELSQADASALPALLCAMDDDHPLAANWLRGAAEIVYERAQQAEGTLPRTELRAILDNPQQPTRARRLIFEWLRAGEPDLFMSRREQFLQDPSMELRRDAVASVLDEAEVAETQQRPEDARRLFRRALDAARDRDQVERATEKLTALGEKVDLVQHFGFVTAWQVVGPFDNRQRNGFDTEYPPEQEAEPAPEYVGRDGNRVAWTSYQSADKMGKVDLNSPFGKLKEVLAYARTHIDTPVGQQVDIRVASSNAVKVWVNGQLCMTHEIYHANNELDQYVAKATLQAGRNLVLVKSCQNEQTEDWTVDWGFQLRICDPQGTAIRFASHANL